MSNVMAAEEKGKVEAYGWAARDASGILSPFHFTRRANGENDITVKILYCGICHSDLHFLKDDFGMTLYPVVPGHEIVGEVTKVGRGVSKFRVGDIAGVPGLCGSCGSCSECNQGLEVYCPKMILTFSARDHDGSVTQGGYSDKIVVDEHFAVVIPRTLPLDGAAPLLCAGISVYSPMTSHGLARPGLHLGVVGLGGLGHVAVKFAKAFEMKVTVISTSPSKKKEALERLGADAFLISKDQQQLQDAVGTMDGIIDTVSGPHSISPLIGLLKTHGKLILVGAPSTPLEFSAMSLLIGGKTITGSAGGGMKVVQEMVDFAAKHRISAEVEVIPMEYVNTALERLANNDVKYRFVIDVANTINSPAMAAH
ncbi:probable mannitol dehydrogenase [Neltuma alba]|uniref:probable mannitol dehydrogenase n=1 Tax=Neltuma alba TaxID=207710 RepID=UPI0010A405B9|nr:probable mannitol dehydrogenase [Prosopis alba]